MSQVYHPGTFRAKLYQILSGAGQLGTERVVVVVVVPVPLDYLLTILTTTTYFALSLPFRGGADANLEASSPSPLINTAIGERNCIGFPLLC